MQEDLAKLKARHDEYIEKCRAAGAKLTAYRAPCCGGLLEARVAPRGQVWDTMAQCPHCGGLYLKITKGDRVTAVVPEE
jgi:Zn finger protein HypA/HybF involved in hydrogenase expression